jgi:hypothetical protein
MDPFKKFMDSVKNAKEKEPSKEAIARAITPVLTAIMGADALAMQDPPKARQAFLQACEPFIAVTMVMAAKMPDPVILVVDPECRGGRTVCENLRTAPNGRDLPNPPERPTVAAVNRSDARLALFDVSENIDSKFAQVPTGCIAVVVVAYNGNAYVALPRENQQRAIDSLNERLEGK